MYIISDDIKPIYVTKQNTHTHTHTLLALKLSDIIKLNSWTGAETHTHTPNGNRADIQLGHVGTKQRSVFSSSLHSTLGSCSHMAGMSQGAPKQGMQGERDEGMQRRGTKWRTKALFGLKDELLCCGTVCWSRSEELDGERKIWGHCGVTLSLCPLSMEEDRERVSFDTFHRFS